jgi:hypothetical protein
LEVTLSATLTATFRFVINNEDPNATKAEVLNRLQTATLQAVEAARAELNAEATAEAEGGTGGLGETAVILALWHAAKVGAGAFATGMASAAGKKFYEKYLAPRLRELNLLPSKLKELSEETVPIKRKVVSKKVPPAHKKVASKKVPPAKKIIE